MDLSATKLNGRNIKEEALKICQEFLGSSWNNISASDLILSKVSGGLSNTLYCCSLPENIIVECSKTPRQVLLRIYGPIQDQNHVIVLEATIFMLLSERQLGPKLYGVFPNGRLEQFIPSKSLNTDEIRKFSKIIAREMAKIHALTVPVRKTTDFFETSMHKWLKEVEYDSTRKYNDHFPQLDFYSEEIDWIAKEMAKTDSPLVFCHNDLQGGNILLPNESLNKEEPNLMLIDFEFGAYNYRDFDIANHFCEWIFDYNTPDPPHFTKTCSKFPTREEKTEFIRTYLEQLVAEGCLDASDIDKELNKMLKVSKLFGMASYLFWSLWSEKMSFISSMAFCHKEHGKVRRSVYKDLKKQYLEERTNMCNGNFDINPEYDENAN